MWFKKKLKRSIFAIENNRNMEKIFGLKRKNKGNTDGPLKGF